MSELVKMSAKAGDFKQAVQVLAGMQSSWGMESGAETQEALAQAVTSTTSPPSGPRCSPPSTTTPAATWLRT
jgi:hypothetical protein